MKIKTYFITLSFLFCAVTWMMAQQSGGSLIKGQVVDSTGEPVIGANVLVVGTTQGVITDVDGYYQLDVKAGATLKISYIGYKDLEVKAK